LYLTLDLASELLDVVPRMNEPGYSVLSGPAPPVFGPKVLDHMRRKMKVIGAGVNGCQDFKLELKFFECMRRHDHDGLLECIRLMNEKKDQDEQSVYRDFRSSSQCVNEILQELREREGNDNIGKTPRYDIDALGCLVSFDAFKRHVPVSKIFLHTCICLNSTSFFHYCA
jgi:hypothetical protein